MQALKRILLGAVILVLAARFAAAGELPTAKPKDVGLDADRIQKVHDAVQALIDQKANAADQDPEFSQKIRESLAGFQE